MLKINDFCSLFVLVLFWSFLLNINSVNAEILNPYVVDEKSRVLFGDSDEVSGYLGLENYKQDYVDNYAHITFTYSHRNCCSASNPPLMYVTAVDPRETPTPLVKESRVLYWLFPNDPTDWYLYDIQFDASGYRIIVKKAGTEEIFNKYREISNLQKEDWIALANNYPMYDPPSEFSMAFTPLPVYEDEDSEASCSDGIKNQDETDIDIGGVCETVPPDCAVDCFSNVLFLPGLEASRLYSTNGQLWEPSSNSDVEELYLNHDGLSINPDIYTRDIIKETNSPVPLGPGGLNIYKSFSDTMDELVSDGEIIEWKDYAYDWRQGVDDIVENGTDHEGGNISLTNTLESLAESSKSGKVTIIAHSNGGLLAKALLKKLQDDKETGISDLIDKVDVLILVAVPQIGTAGAVPGMLHGYDQEILKGLLLDKMRARELGRNMPGAYGLLPSEEYINRVNASPATFVDTGIPSGVSTKLVQSFGSAIDSYGEYKDFLFGGEGRTNPAKEQTNLPISLSESLFFQAEDLHDEIDNFVPPEDLRVIEIAGWGLETVASFEYYPKLVCEGLICKYVLDQRPRFTSDGDKTVVVPSAQYMSSAGNAEKYWIDLPTHNRELRRLRKNREHADILEVDQLNNFVQSIIINAGLALDNIIKNNEPENDSNLIRLSVHSPVTIDAYDAAGNHTGKVCPTGNDFCYVEEGILNSSYLEFGEGKYLNLPEDQISKVKLQGTDLGTFTYESEKVLPDGSSTLSSFIDIPVTTQTQAEITLNQITKEPQLALDVTGDGVSDFTLTPNQSFDPVVYLQIMKTTINSLDLPQGKKTAFNNRVDKLIKSIQSGQIDKARLKADRFKFQLEKVLSKPDPKNPKPKKLSKTDAQLLLDMLNKLLDNIS